MIGDPRTYTAPPWVLTFIRLSDDCWFFFTFILVVFLVLVIIVVGVFRRQTYDSDKAEVD